MRGRTLEARPRMTRVRERVRPTDSKARRASRWISGSTSMVVSTPSGPIPSRIHRPDTPVPVPISATRLRKIQNTTYTGDLTKIELKDNINENIKEKDNILLIPLCKKCYSNKTVHKRNISFKEDYIGCF